MTHYLVRELQLDVAYLGAYTHNEGILCYLDLVVAFIQTVFYVKLVCVCMEPEAVSKSGDPQLMSYSQMWRTWVHTHMRGSYASWT